MKKKILIVGAGGIGKACGFIIARHKRKNIHLILADIDYDQCKKAADWIRSELTFKPNVTTIALPPGESDSWNPDSDILLDCTPGEFAPGFAQTALRCGMHYANLTENLPSTRKIYQIAQSAKKGFALQTGLAPGFINQLARLTLHQFKNKYPNSHSISIKMRVGSLGKFATSPGFYSFVWNPKGVATEYLNDCEVIKHSKKSIVPSLSERESIVVNGTFYEADLTSGGAADLPTFFDGSVEELNYKTLRYPGHYDYIDDLKKDLGVELSRTTLLQRMKQEIPFQDQDRVLIYCSVSGLDQQENRHELIHYSEILPLQYKKIQLTAIQRATASALAQTALLLLTDRFKGVLFQSNYPLEEYLQGEIIREHYGTFFENI